MYPPTEFVTAGLTIKDIFSGILGNEHRSFVQFHVRRSVLTLFVHSVLPFGYGYGLIIFEHVNDIHYIMLWSLFICSFLIPVYALYKIWDWGKDVWRKHPIARNLAIYCNNGNGNEPPGDWCTVANDINVEYERSDKLIIATSSISFVVITDNWIIKVLPYTIKVAHQSDALLIVNNSDTHEMSPMTGREVQFINIEVKSMRAGAESFDIRLNVFHFKKLQEKIARPITILENIKFQKSLLDKFIDNFKEQAQENPRYSFTEELDQCVGCMQAVSNVKLNKLCNSEIGSGNPDECMVCYCRPMWCIDCMAKWFASKQDEDAPETWFSSTCTCPVCRARFCILDVCLIQSN